MKLKVNVVSPKIIPVSELKEGQLGVATAEFRGELFFRNVAGIHGLSEHRCWVSDYIEQSRTRDFNVRVYVPSFPVQILEAGDTIHVTE